jgi:DHA1 family multidrug resistance protein-like MFS transporter
VTPVPEQSSAPSIAAPFARSGFGWRFRDYHLVIPALTVRMANTMSVSALPLLLIGLGFPARQVGLIVSLGGLTSMVMNFIGGIVSDYFVKKRLMLAGMAGLSVVTILLGVARSGYQFMALRLGQGLATSFFRPASQALAYEINPSRRAYVVGMLGSSYVLGNATGPALGGLIADHLGMSWSMIVGGGIAGLGALYLLAFSGTLPSSRRSHKPLRGQLLGVLRRGRVQLAVPMLVVMADAWILNGWQAYMPIYLKRQVGLSYTMIGLLVGIESATYVICQPLAGRVLDRFGLKVPLMVSMLGHGLFIACIPLHPTIPWITFCLVMVGVTNSAANPGSVLLTARLSREEDRGLSLGLLSASSNLGQFVGPIVGGAIITVLGEDRHALSACLAPAIIGALAPIFLARHHPGEEN